jgi:Ca2+-binding RTX toxin-like protein
MKTGLRILVFGAASLILASMITAVAATNTVPPTNADQQSMSIGLNDIKPPACGGIDATNLVIGTGTFTGTEANDLILASSTADVIDGLGGDDCIVGGGDSDTCTGGAGDDVFINCETEIP